MEEKDRKCIIKSKSYHNMYLKNTAVYTDKLYEAKIFQYGEVPKYLLDEGVIFLDSKEGLELLSKEIEYLDNKIPQEEDLLSSLKKGRERLFESNPEMLSKYIELHNKFYNPIIGISENQKQSIINRIIEENKN